MDRFFSWHLGRLLWACDIFFISFCLNYLGSCQNNCISQIVNEVQWSSLHVGFLNASPIPLLHWHPTRDFGHGQSRTLSNMWCFYCGEKEYSTQQSFGCRETLISNTAPTNGNILSLPLQILGPREFVRAQRSTACITVYYTGPPFLFKRLSIF